ncbi:RNA-directed DNA polymerase from mobile element jockey [Odontesthes bonariensis]|uniref:RNA-directed DNA polymerase from mobile element jockey n=1 Tax=Odontesthes bonariensis TaxID=219752 RepID=UPI003F58BA80
MPVLFEIKLSCTKVKPCAAARFCRVLNPSTAGQFSLVFNQNCTIPETVGNKTEDLSNWFYSTIKAALDSVAPLKIRLSKSKHEPWLNDDTRAARRNCRKAERKWKKDKLQVSFQILKECWRCYQRTVKDAKRRHLSDLIVSNSHNPSVLFKTIDSVLNAPHGGFVETSPAVCESFLHFFVEKVTSIRAQIIPSVHDPSVFVPCSAVFHSFECVTLQSLQEVVSHLRPTGSPDDAIPPRLFNDVFLTIGPSVLALVNSSLSSGVVPENLKHAVVQPLIKKPVLDPAVLANYRPISKLPFVSKILEKVVCNQLMAYLIEHNILEVFQSGFKSFHSTESALLKVFNDIFLATDSGDCVVLVLLDLSAAFDTVDHRILLSRLEQFVGIGHIALDWFKSYLAKHTFCVCLDGHRSSSATLSCGVPQGSVLGPLLFLLYLLPLGSVFKKYGIAFHCYADDTQIYVPLKKADSTSLRSLFLCLEDLKAWMALNFLKLNEDKTEVVIFGSSSEHSLSDACSLAQYVKPVVTNLGVKMDAGLKLEAHIRAVVKSS